jgi:CO/xanthine dehydrogenase Mo-binding subunit
MARWAQARSKGCAPEGLSWGLAFLHITVSFRPAIPWRGAGESSIRPVAAALANAVFDASGVRLRRAPLTPQRLKPALA